MRVPGFRTGAGFGVGVGVGRKMFRCAGACKGVRCDCRTFFERVNGRVHVYICVDAGADSGVDGVMRVLT